MRTDFQRAGGKSDVTRAQNILQIRRLNTVLNQPFLRVVEINLLRQHALAINLGNFRRALHRPCDQIGKVVQLAIGIIVSGNRGETSHPSLADRE